MSSKFLMLLISVFGACLISSQSMASSSWDLKGEYTVETYIYGLETYHHTMVIDEMDVSSGEFSGNGWANGYKYLYTWTITGTVSGSNINATLNFTGEYTNTGYSATWTNVQVDSKGMIYGDFQEYNNQHLEHTGSFEAMNVDAVAAVPVPGTALLLGSCLLLLARLQRK